MKTSNIIQDRLRAFREQSGSSAMSPAVMRTAAESNKGGDDDDDDDDGVRLCGRALKSAAAASTADKGDVVQQALVKVFKVEPYQAPSRVSESLAGRIHQVHRYVNYET